MPSFFRQEMLHVLLSEDEIRARVRELGEEIRAHYEDKGDDLIVVGILKGCFVFLSDLVRAIELPLEVDFIGLSSYGDATESSGVVRLTSDLSRPIEGKHVLVVEDIVDTGLTMRYLLENLRTREPKSIKLCSLLEKPSKSQGKVKIDYLGFTIPDEFVIGYGLDAGEKYRNLPFIAVREG